MPSDIGPDRAARAQYLVDPGSSDSGLFEPAQGMERTVLQDDLRQTVMFVNTMGQTSSRFENHLSNVTLEIVGGAGIVAMRGCSVSVQDGDVIKVDRKMPYQYGGDMGVLATFSPPLISETVSVDGETLSKEGRRIVRLFRAGEIITTFQELAVNRFKFGSRGALSQEIKGRSGLSG